MFYVYTYTDPRTDKIFYVGKGKKYRSKSHLKPSLWKNPRATTNPFFYYKIKSMMDRRITPIIKIVKNFENELEALKYENAMIQELKTFNDGGQLYNICKNISGPNSGNHVKWSEKRKKDFRELCKDKRIFDPTYEDLYELYINKNMKRKEIADLYGVSDALVKVRLKEHQIKKSKDLENKNKERKIEKTCPVCGEVFYTIPSSRVKFCSYNCSYKRNQLNG